MPSFGGAQNYSGMLQSQVNQLAPLATTWSGPAHGVAPEQVFNAPPTTKSSGVLGFLGGVASQIGHIAGGVGSWLEKNVVQMAEAPLKFGAALGHNLVDQYEMGSISSRQTQLNGQLENLHNMFKSGKISSKEYQLGLKELSGQFSDLSNEAMGLNKQAGLDHKATVQPAVDTASLIVTIATAGLGGGVTDALISRAGLEPVAAKTASDYLVSTNANAFLDNVETAIQRFATNPGTFDKLEPAAKMAIQRATAEVVASNTTMTAGQIARGAAINLTLKYPIYYNYLSTTGAQIYKELDQRKFGDAVRTLAFNAALMLSGGPIGQALKYGGDALKGLSERTFGQTSFWDELSKFYGDGSRDGFSVAISRMAEGMGSTERSQFLKNLSAVEATNVSAMAGDAGAGAFRVANGMKSMYGDGISLTNISHEDGIKDMVNYAEAFRLADAEAQRLGMDGIAIGRVDAKQLDVIASELSPSISAGKQETINAWESLKATNPNQAWANNANFDKQVLGLIDRSSTPEELSNALRNISASFNIPSFSRSVARKLARMGYIPIKPVNLEAPFKEGTGKILSQAPGAGDFFIQAVKPLPVLDYLGVAVNSLGISPNASTQKVYELFNDNLAKNLGGNNAETDTLIKRLSNYAHNPTRGNVMSHLPITDLRMLTTADIREALNVSSRRALEIQKAIADSYVQVPLAIRGLGDRLVDLSYKGPVGAAMRRYLRIQGSIRFAWNPFFQYLRVIPKTEVLTTAEAGGYISSIFNGKLGELSDTRQALRDIGAFDKTPGGLGKVISGEAAEYGGSTAANLSKKLLPQQERSIAGLVVAQADRLGMDTKEYISTFPQQVRDTVQMIAQYDRRSNFLNSPLARTLNIVIFPFRFDAKVLGILTRSIARTAPLTQVALVNGMFRAHDWLNSQEGMAWYAKNADAIGLFKYITPVATFAEVFSSLTPGHDHSIGNFGELGGLPFGWIPQILDAEGITQFNQPGVIPQTGEAYPKYIPIDARGQVATAIQDFISSIFSYPGATLGLPSKTKLTQNIAFPLVGANKSTDFQKTTPTLNPEQQRFSDAIKAANPNTVTSQPGYQEQQLPEAQRPTPNVEPNATAPQTQVPRLPSQLDTMPGKLSKSGGSKKKKKSDYRPYLLPGQTKLGEL